MQDIQNLWDALKAKIIPLIDRRTADCIRTRTYDVVTPPDGETIGVMLPYGTDILHIPYCPACGNAKYGDSVLVLYRYNFRDATAFCMAGQGLKPAG